MARRRIGLYLIGGGLVAGTVIALVRSSRAALPPAAPPPVLQGNSGVVPPHLRGESTTPVDLLAPLNLPGNPTLEQVLQLLVAYNAALKDWRAYLDDVAAGMGVSRGQASAALLRLQELNKRVDTKYFAKEWVAPLSGLVLSAAASLLATASAAANAVPIVGQVAAAVTALIAWSLQVSDLLDWKNRGLTKSELDAGVNIRNRPPERNGWQAGCYFFHDVPVFGPKVDDFNEGMSPSVKEGVWGAQWKAVYALAKTHPYGPPVPRVEVLGDGTYQYAYNKLGNNDTSQEAQGRAEVFLGRTTDPADVRATGPAGDSQKPRPGYFRPSETQVSEYWRGYQESTKRGALPRSSFTEADSDFYYELGLSDGSRGLPALWKPATQPAPWRPEEAQVAEYWKGYAQGADGARPRAGFSESEADYYFQLGVSDASQGLPPLWPLQPPPNPAPGQPQNPIPVDPVRGGL